MKPRNIAWMAAGTAAMGSAVLSSATIWLLMTQPITVANAVSGRDLGPLLQAVAGVVYEALLGLVRYL